MLTTHVVPRSTATNLYDLFADVCIVIRDEPRRVYMPDVIRAFKKKNLKVMEVDFIDGEELPVTTIHQGPACGTVGCIAGWLKIMTRKNDRNLLRPSQAQFHILREIHNWFLDTDPYYGLGELYQAAYTLFTENFPHATYGTRAYARHVVKNIKKFMAKYKTELQSRPVPRD